MSTFPGVGYMIGEADEEAAKKVDRGYTHKTNDCLAGDNATPFPVGDVAAVGFEPPPQIREPQPCEGVSFRKAMADQGDEELKLALRRL